MNVVHACSHSELSKVFCIADEDTPSPRVDALVLQLVLMSAVHAYLHLPSNALHQGRAS